MFDPVTALIGGGATLLGGLISSDTARRATHAQMAMGAQSNELQKRMFDLQRADLAPWRNTGQSALGRINQLYGFGGQAPNRADFMSGGSYNQQQAEYDPTKAANELMQSDPGYAFRMQEGNKALQNSLLARGGALSGAALKAGQRYSQGMASQEFGSAYNRLLGLANMGAGAAGQQAGFAGQYGANVGNTLQNMGNVQAAGAINQGNIWNNAINQGMSMYGQYGGR